GGPAPRLAGRDQRADRLADPDLGGADLAQPPGGRSSPSWDEQVRVIVPGHPPLRGRGFELAAELLVLVRRADPVAHPAPRHDQALAGEIDLDDAVLDVDREQALVDERLQRVGERRAVLTGRELVAPLSAPRRRAALAEADQAQQDPARRLLAGLVEVGV